MTIFSSFVSFSYIPRTYSNVMEYSREGENRITMLTRLTSVPSIPMLFLRRSPILPDLLLLILVPELFLLLELYEVITLISESIM